MLRKTEPVAQIRQFVVLVVDMDRDRLLEGLGVHKCIFDKRGIEHPGIDARKSCGDMLCKSAPKRVPGRNICNGTIPKVLFHLISYRDNTCRATAYSFSIGIRPVNHEKLANQSRQLVATVPQKATRTVGISLFLMSAS